MTIISMEDSIMSSNIDSIRSAVYNRLFKTFPKITNSRIIADNIAIEQNLMTVEDASDAIIELEKVNPNSIEVSQEMIHNFRSEAVLEIARQNEDPEAIELIHFRDKVKDLEMIIESKYGTKLNSYLRELKSQPGVDSGEIDTILAKQSL